MKKTIDVSVIILNYNTVELTSACLASIERSHLDSYRLEVIVCDNASSDNSEQILRQKFPDVTVIQNGANVGFAAGNNPGIRRSHGRYVVLLNSDTEVMPDTFATMIRFMDAHPEAGAATCLLNLRDGSMDPACHRGFPSPWVAFTYIFKLESLFPRSRLFGEYHQGYKDVTAVHEVDCISGAFFMVPRAVIDDVGYLDEDYFMYAEDIDWAYRIRKSGKRIWFVPTTSILHKKKQSGRAHTEKSRRLTTELYFHTYNWLFFKKHFIGRSHPLVSFVVNTGYRFRIWLLKIFSL